MQVTCKLLLLSKWCAHRKQIVHLLNSIANRLEGQNVWSHQHIVQARLSSLCALGAWRHILAPELHKGDVFVAIMGRNILYISVEQVPIVLQAVGFVILAAPAPLAGTQQQQHTPQNMSL